MRHGHFATTALLGCLIATPAFAAQDCSVKSLPQALPLRSAALPPLSSELPGSGHQLGSPDGVLAYTGNDAQAVDRVLLRLRMENCQNAPQATDSAQPAVQAAGYVPRTKWDNTPYRFSAGGNGKKFTAADFTAWMASKGIHVSTGKPETAPVEPATQPQSAPPGK